MSALDTRAFIQSGGDYYLTPLSGVGDVPEKLEELLKPVWNRQQSLTLIRNDEEAIALGYETIVHKTHQSVSSIVSSTVDWEERILVVFFLWQETQGMDCVIDWIMQSNPSSL